MIPASKFHAIRTARAGFDNDNKPR